MTDDEVKKIDTLQRLGSTIGTARFICLVCGFANRLQFSGAEMRELDDDLTKYTGPCPDCNGMSLCHDLLHRYREDPKRDTTTKNNLPSKYDLSDR
jgi:hypothetical protein